MQASMLADSEVPDGGKGWLLTFACAVVTWSFVGASYTWGVSQAALVEQMCHSSSWPDNAIGLPLCMHYALTNPIHNPCTRCCPPLHTQTRNTVMIQAPYRPAAFASIRFNLEKLSSSFSFSSSSSSSPPYLSPPLSLLPPSFCLLEVCLSLLLSNFSFLSICRHVPESLAADNSAGLPSSFRSACGAFAFRASTFSDLPWVKTRLCL